MPEVFGLDHRIFAVGTVALSVGVTAYATYRLGQRQQARRQHREQNFYEEERALQEYLLLHYGTTDETLPYDFGPKDSLHFPRRCAELCRKHFQAKDDIPSRALDIGCAVGGATFELSRAFQEVLGIDYSDSFIRACQHLKDEGELDYSVTTEGELTKPLTARVNPSLDRTRAVFQRGDACSLPSDLGRFGCVLAANLICRLHAPRDFLSRLADLVAPGGVLVITAPYTFLAEFTPREKWLGGYKTADGKDFTGFDGLCQCLQPAFELLEQEDMPFFIRETARKNQWTVSHVTVWRRT